MGIKPTEFVSEASLQSSILERIRWIFDPVDMDHILQIDKNLVRQIIAQRLETHAEINRSIAEGSLKAAKLMR